jgi:very-short-patch-repair endonuclease
VGAREARSCYREAMKRRIDKRLTDRARELRNNPTPQEFKIWQLLSRYRPKFTRQLSIHPYAADLACRQAKLVVELDGSQHVASEYDMERTRVLESRGWTVIRFWNSEVDENADGVAAAILDKAAECLGGTHPQPLPSREGRKRRCRRS